MPPMAWKPKADFQNSSERKGFLEEKLEAPCGRSPFHWSSLRGASSQSPGLGVVSFLTPARAGEAVLWGLQVKLVRLRARRCLLSALLARQFLAESSAVRLFHWVVNVAFGAGNGRMK